MTDEEHNPMQCLTQLRQTLSADKLATGFFLGAGCPCAVRVSNAGGGDRPIIPDIRGLTAQVRSVVSEMDKCRTSLETLDKTFAEDSLANPTIETILNRIRSFREVAGAVGVRGISFEALDDLDKSICQSIRQIVTCSLPAQGTPYHALAKFIRSHRTPFTEVFTTNYDVLIEQALEQQRVPYFDGFIGSSQPFFDHRAIEDDEIPLRWSRVWKLHGSINWRFNAETKAVFRSEDAQAGDELLIHPSHRKYDDSRRMPYFVMIDRLRNFLRNALRPVALFVIGYSFGDEHINEVIVESLKLNASAACFALQYGRLSQYAEAIKLANENANLSIIAPDEAIIRRRRGRWLASPTMDVTALKGCFEIEEGNEKQANEQPPDKPRPCRMVLGDFKEFGKFLDRYFDASSSENFGGNG